MTVSQLLTSWNKKLSAVLLYSLLQLVVFGKITVSTLSILLVTLISRLKFIAHLKVLDGGVGVFCGSGGVEPQSETNWRYANDSRSMLVLIFVNKLDRLGADFYRVVKQTKDVLGANPLVMVLPIGTEDEFVGVVDLLTRKAWVWDDTGLPENYQITDVPADMVDQVEEYRENA